jgi:formylmethanofuran dehydrogenase subunit C
MLLKPKFETRIPVIAECITPDLVSGKSSEEIRELKVYHGNKEKSLKELFDVSDDNSDTVTIAGSVPWMKCIGKKMTTGKIVIEGDAGMHTGAQMKGGTITVKGNVSDWAGAEMRGGEMFIHGNAGNCLGSAYRGSKSGMNKGLIVVRGDCGSEAGELMKKGIIVVQGNIGELAGCSMKGGTIFCYGHVGGRVGAFMERGSIVLYNEPQLLPTFTYNALYNPTWLRVFLLDLQKKQYKIPIKKEHIEGSYERYNGDLQELGKGEIFVFRG